MTYIYEFHAERVKPTGRTGWIKDIVKINHPGRLTKKDIEQITEAWEEDLDCVRQVNPLHTLVTVRVRELSLLHKYAHRYDYEVRKDSDGKWDLINHSKKTLTPLFENDNGGVG